ncbi:hypothetical protein BGX34_002454 [Mortierella sp. NVP85]|nr:hypothetical protein BGX34_002454 [Mortierella sp. NVP85]
MPRAPEPRQAKAPERRTHMSSYKSAEALVHERVGGKGHHGLRSQSRPYVELGDLELLNKEVRADDIHYKKNL